MSAARASREHPVLLEMLADGRLHPSAIAKLSPHLTPESRDELLRRATHSTKRVVDELVAELAPRPDAPALIRRLPAGRFVTRPASKRPDVCGAIPDRPSLALCPERVDSEYLDVVGGAKTAPQTTDDRMALAAIIGIAVTEKLERLEARRFGRTTSPRKSVSTSDVTRRRRQVPAAVKRVVHERDEGRCRYVDAEGHRCTARGGIEFHHRRPWGVGGDHSPGNVGLLCHVHNRYLAEIDFGCQAVGKHRRSKAGPPGAETS